MSEGCADREDFLRWMMANLCILSLEDKRAVLSGLEELIGRHEISEELKHGIEM